MDTRRVVVTGLGALTPVGNTVEEFWSALMQGKSGIGPITKFDAQAKTESGEFQFPITVCNGCLVSFSGADDPATPGLDCNLPLSQAGGGGGNSQLPCKVGQDEPVPCQLCAPFSALCRGQAQP